MSQVSKIEVGKYFEGKPKKIAECCSFTYTKSAGFLLLLAYAKPTPAEVNSFKHGSIKVAFLFFRNIIFFLNKFGNQDWNDSSFNYWSVPPEERAIPPLLNSPEERILLNAILLDSRDSLVKAIRAYTPSPDFSRRLVRAIHSQANGCPIYDTQYNNIIATCYSEFPTSKSMLPYAIIDNPK